MLKEARVPAVLPFTTWNKWSLSGSANEEIKLETGILCLFIYLIPLPLEEQEPPQQLCSDRKIHVLVSKPLSFIFAMIHVLLFVRESVCVVRKRKISYKQHGFLKFFYLFFLFGTVGELIL